MFPLYDLNPTRRVPVLTYVLIAINVIVFFWQLSLDGRSLQLMFLEQSVVPFLVSRAPFAPESLLDGLRSMFFHGGWLHLISNMLYLWIFGDNIEDRLGKIPFLLLYFISGYAAVYAQVAIDPVSRVPLVGASGAIAGVLGAYALLYPRASVRGLIFFGFFAQFVELPALIVLGFWFILQLFNGLASLGVNTMSGGVAFFAHVGGFVAGLLIAQLMIRFIPDPRDSDAIFWDR